MTPDWFVAWPVNGAEEWLANLEAAAPGGLNFLTPDDLHVTLAFLGHYEPGLQAKMSALLEKLAFSEIEMSPGEFVALPQPRRFSALVSMLNVGKREVEGQIEKWRALICREAGARVDPRCPLPHVTFARPDRRIGSEDRDAALDWIAQLVPQSSIRFQLGRPRLYTWAEKGSLDRYRILD